MPHGRGSAERRRNRRLADRKGGGTQAGVMRSSRAETSTPKFARVDVAGVLEETATWRDRLRKRWRRRNKH